MKRTVTLSLVPLISDNDGMTLSECISDSSDSVLAACMVTRLVYISKMRETRAGRSPTTNITPGATMSNFEKADHDSEKQLGDANVVDAAPDSEGQHEVFRDDGTGENYRTVSW